MDVVLTPVYCSKTEAGIRVFARVRKKHARASSRKGGRKNTWRPMQADYATWINCVEMRVNAHPRRTAQGPALANPNALGRRYKNSEQRPNSLRP